ncbi:FecR family protein [Chitinophagaceae bacterium LB-8]|uniref:FecR family protein n=1 Tax=Paraflavisolibacter caeni TaxID=2982496 RepID=A0A9X3BA61_9BACT|nr:FecR family protein [Paraflavisolibacter caeni]MCU7552231.1 FecR family protein [Paraflavisolibacter caeni]
MNDYSQYDVDDFIMDQDFINWVFDNNTEDNVWWQNWLLQNPHKQSMISEARTILLSFKVKEKSLEEETLNHEMRAIMDRIQKPRTMGILASLSRWKYAAILIGILVTGAVAYYTLLPFSSINNENLADADLPAKKRGLIEEYNSGSKDKIVHMQDGSTIRLAPKAIIRYAEQFSSLDTRDVFLSGEAFFEVTKNPNKPFRVFSHELVTKVLGTSFTIKANEKDQKISIIVRTGKVAVYDKTNIRDKKELNSKNLNGMVLTPNQELVYSRQQQKFQKTLIDRPVMINPAEIKNNFQYEDVPVVEVLEQIREAYSISIVYDKEAVKNCKLTADLRDESIYKKLELICKAMDAKYQVIDGQVTIEAKPCE